MSTLHRYRVIVEETVTAEGLVTAPDAEAAGEAAIQLLAREPERLAYIGSMFKLVRVEEVRS